MPGLETQARPLPGGGLLPVGVVLGVSAVSAEGTRPRCNATQQGGHLR
jgi:hypothetical protein